MAAAFVTDSASSSHLASVEVAMNEWIVTNESGAHAASTEALEHTRGHHGLLGATVDSKQYVVLSRIDVRGTPIELDEDGSPRRRTLADLLDLGWSGDHGVMPAVQSFTPEPRPRFSFSLPDVDGALTLEIALHPTAAAVRLRYGWVGDDALRLHLRPLLAMRAIDQRGKEHGAMSQGVEIRRGEARVRPRKDLPQVCFSHEGIFVGSPDWWLGTESTHAFIEDLWTPGILEAVLEPGGFSHVVCALGPLPELWP